MKKALLFCILMTGCFTIPFPKSNLTNEQVLSIRNGHTSDQIKEAFGNPIYWQNFEDGSSLHIYTNDWVDGSRVFCRNLAIHYNSGKKVTSHSFTNNGSDPKSRCDQYSAYYAQRAASWSALASTYSEAVDNSINYNKEGKSCYGNHYCSEGQVCARKKNGYGFLDNEGVCVNVRYYEAD